MAAQAGQRCRGQCQEPMSETYINMLYLLSLETYFPLIIFLSDLLSTGYLKPFLFSTDVSLVYESSSATASQVVQPSPHLSDIKHVSGVLVAT